MGATRWVCAREVMRSRETGRTTGRTAATRAASATTTSRTATTTASYIAATTVGADTVITTVMNTGVFVQQRGEGSNRFSRSRNSSSLRTRFSTMLATLARNDANTSSLPSLAEKSCSRRSSYCSDWMHW